MKDKFQRLADQAYELTKKIDPQQQQGSLICQKLDKVLKKIDSMEGAVLQSIPHLETRVKERDGTIKKMKKSIKVLETRTKELQSNTKTRDKFVDWKSNYKFKQEQCGCTPNVEAQKYKTKYLEANERLKDRKTKIEQLEQRIKELQDKNQGLIEQNRSQTMLIQGLVCELQQRQLQQSATYSQISQQYFPQDQAMICMDDQSEDMQLRKQSDEIETDDENDEQVLFLIQHGSEMQSSVNTSTNTNQTPQDQAADTQTEKTDDNQCQTITTQQYTTTSDSNAKKQAMQLWKYWKLFWFLF